MDFACYSGTHADTNTASASLFISVALVLKLIQELVWGIVGTIQVDKLWLLVGERPHLSSVSLQSNSDHSCASITFHMG